MLKAKGNEVLDETGKQLCVVLATSCTKRDAKRWAQYIVDRVNADERGKSFTKETTVESREPKTPEDWEYWPEKPMHSLSVHHRGRIVDDIWRCWDCPATHGVEYTSDRGRKT